jgi:hypothetical protein
MNRQIGTSEGGVPFRHRQRTAMSSRFILTAKAVESDDDADDTCNDPVRFRQKMFCACIIAIPASIGMWAIIFTVFRML